MLSILLISAVVAGLTHAGHRAYAKLKPRINIVTPTEWFQRPVLEGAEWDEFYRAIKEDCKGWRLTHAMVNSVFEHGFRFSCGQIYALSNDCHQRFKGGKESIKDLLKYQLTVQGEAAERVQKLIFSSDDKLLLAD